jgi:hypothetical protein
MLMKPKTAILKKPYTVFEQGRGQSTQFTMPREWVRNSVPWLWNTYKETQKSFYLFWSEPNTSKFHACVVAGEYVPLIGNRMVLVHTNQLTEQHTQHLNHWIDQGYAKQPWYAETIQSVYRLILKAEEKGLDILSEDEVERLHIINQTCFLVLDELHKYSKNTEENIKQITTILTYMKNFGNLQIILGTTATAQKLKAVWEWAGTYIEQNLYTYKTSPEELQNEGWKPVPVSYIWADNETTLVDLSDLESNNVDVDDDKAVQKYLWTINSPQLDDICESLKDEGHKLKFLKDEIKKYIANRVSVAVDNWQQDYIGEVAIISMNGISNAVDAENKFKPILNLLGYDCVAWNSESKNDHSAYKNNEKKMMEDLFNPAHPLKIVFVNGMLQEGTNKPFKVAYQTNFSVYNPERSIQFTARAQEAVIILDAPIMRSMPDNQYANQAVADILGDAKCPYSPEELQAAITAEAIRQGTITATGKTPGTEIDVDAMFNSVFGDSNDQETDDGVSYHKIFSNNVWVYDVNHTGTTIKVPIPSGSQIHQSLEQAAQILAGEAIV